MPTDDQRFDAGQATIDAIRAEGMQHFAHGIANLAQAFDPSDRTLRCIDEGTPGGIHSAGAGILHPFDDVVAWMRAAGADAVTSHTGCGAAVLAASRAGLPPEQAEVLAQEHSRRLAEALGVPYAGHVTELRRPAHLHDARAAYYDGTGMFDPSRVTALPKGFVISRGHLPASAAAEEAAIACAIELGEHGFGAHFTPDRPFLLIAIADPTDPERTLLVLQEELAPIIAAHGGRVVLDGFVK